MSKRGVAKDYPEDTSYQYDYNDEYHYGYDYDYIGLRENEYYGKDIPPYKIAFPAISSFLVLVSLVGCVLLFALMTSPKYRTRPFAVVLCFQAVLDLYIVSVHTLLDYVRLLEYFTYRTFLTDNDALEFIFGEGLQPIEWMSMWCLVLLSLDRYVAICHPLKHPVWCTRKRAAILCLFTFVTLAGLQVLFVLKAEGTKADYDDNFYRYNDRINDLESKLARYTTPYWTNMDFGKDDHSFSDKHDTTYPFTRVSFPSEDGTISYDTSTPYQYGDMSEDSIRRDTSTSKFDPYPYEDDTIYSDPAPLTSNLARIIPVFSFRFFLPVPIIIYLNYKIISAIRENTKLTASSKSKVDNNIIKITLSLSVMCIVSLLTYTPFEIYQDIGEFGVIRVRHDSGSEMGGKFLHLFMRSNFCINFYLLLVTGSTYRTDVAALLCKKR